MCGGAREYKSLGRVGEKVVKGVEWPPCREYLVMIVCHSVLALRQV